MAQAKDHIPLSEPFCTPDQFATELGAVEVIGPCVRLTFVTKQRTQYSEHYERVVIAKIVLPAEVVRQLPIDLPALMGGSAPIFVSEIERANLN